MGSRECGTAYHEEDIPPRVVRHGLEEVRLEETEALGSDRVVHPVLILGAHLQDLLRDGLVEVCSLLRLWCGLGFVEALKNSDAVLLQHVARKIGVRMKLLGLENLRSVTTSMLQDEVATSGVLIEEPTRL